MHNNVNSGVSCEVSTCIHYEQGNRCNANIIHVGNPNADCSSDTRCDTFEERA